MVKGSLIVSLAFFSLVLFPSAPALAASAQGTLQVQVEDETGAIVPDAHIYIYNDQNTRLVATKESGNNAEFSLALGDYRLYAATTRKGSDYVDHLMSPQIPVRLTVTDSVHVVLRLRDQSDPLSRLTAEDLTRMGLDPDLIKDLN